MVDRCLSGVKATGTGISDICEGVNLVAHTLRGREEGEMNLSLCMYAFTDPVKTSQ